MLMTPQTITGLCFQPQSRSQGASRGPKSLGGIGSGSRASAELWLWLADRIWGSCPFLGFIPSFLISDLIPNGIPKPGSVLGGYLKTGEKNGLWSHG